MVEGVPQLQARLSAIGKVSPDLMRTLGRATVREAKLLVPRRTSNLGRTIHLREATADHAIVEASAKYAAYVEFGTRPHEITPHVRKALRWAATPQGRRLSGSPRVAAQRGALGGVVFARRVHHPGTRPHPYMRPAAERAVANEHLAKVVIDAWNGAA